MGKIPAAIGYLACALLVASQPSLAKTIDLSGKWTGKTLCPLGEVSFTIEVKGRTGTFSHSGYGPNKMHPARFPIGIRTTTGWEGEWVYFEKPVQSARDHESFSSISGLLSADERTLSVRGIGIGDCSAFKLTKATVPSSEPSTPVARRSRGGEPSEKEMRAAVEYYLGNIGGRENGATTTLSKFKKHGCTLAKERPGYLCEYTLQVNYQNHFKAHDDLFRWIMGGRDLPEETAYRRFLYDSSRNRWVLYKD